MCPDIGGWFDTTDPPRSVFRILGMTSDAWLFLTTILAVGLETVLDLSALELEDVGRVDDRGVLDMVVRITPRLDIGWLDADVVSVGTTFFVIGFGLVTTADLAAMVAAGFVDTGDETGWADRELGEIRFEETLEVPASLVNTEVVALLLSFDFASVASLFLVVIDEDTDAEGLCLMSTLAAALGRVLGLFPVSLSFKL